MIPTKLRWVILDEGTNISVGFDYYVRIYIESKTTTAPSKKGASHGAFKSKAAGVVSSQKGTTKLGAQVQEYRPELMSALGEAL